ncbi:hypothetical protein [Streptomyces sp. SP18BB07]|uniref:hypothetical protein n=1 Tax=Streptomyces sp. SP18BB07 TaxID=3002522 RepID=UPI002E787F24|nr:hypothetical protein [Streptomyces sp. SP18BB07]MEE1764349.1 hypothetical protein [Streptomyces sp. SP18BB07]
MLRRSFDTVRLPGGLHLMFQSVADDGGTLRTWHTIGLPVRLTLTTVTQTRDAYYGPADNRPPGQWKRVLRALATANGRPTSYYCPSIPPSRRGVALAVPRYTVELRWETRRWDEAVTEHLQRPCPACRAAGWRRAEDAT